MIFNQKESYSKSKFFILKKKNKFYVIKRPTKINSREFLSIKKQNNFKNLKIKNYKVSSAKIISNIQNIKKKRAYLVEYFDGKNGADILLQGNKTEIIMLKEFFKNYFFLNFKNTTLSIRDLQNFKEKISKIKNNKNFKLIRNSKEFLNYLNLLLKKKIYNLSNKRCHGDLTLSNMIINSKKKSIILIDFLSCYEENIIQDIAKIFQEFELHWTARNYSRADSLRSKIVYSAIINNNFWRGINKNLIYTFKLEFLMVVLRIIPYIKKDDNITINWIENSLYKIIKFKM